MPLCLSSDWKVLFSQRAHFLSWVTINRCVLVVALQASIDQAEISYKYSCHISGEPILLLDNIIIYIILLLDITIYENNWM